MHKILFILAQVFYLVAFVDSLLGEDHKPAWLERARLPSIWLGASVHLLGLVVLGLQSQAFPVHTPGASMASLGLLVVLGHLLVRRGPRMESLGAFFLPLAVILLVVAQVLPASVAGIANSGLGMIWFPIHASMVFLGLVAFTLSFGVSFYYLVVRSRLKRKQLDGLERLPSLVGLDRLNVRLMLFGFVSLALGIGSGGVWASSVSGATLDITGWVTIAAWIWYGIALQFRLVAGWRGRLAALASVVGFVGLVGALVGVNVLFDGWHA